MPYKIKKQQCKMKSGEPGEAVRYRKITHSDGSVTLKKAACHKSVPAAHAAIRKIHDSHNYDFDSLSKDLYETIIDSLLIPETMTSDDKTKINMRSESDLFKTQIVDALLEDISLAEHIETLLEEKVTASDARRVEDVARIYLNDVSHVKNEKDYFRIHSPHNEKISNEKKIEIARQIIRTAFSLTQTTSKNVGLRDSRMYPSYEVTGWDDTTKNYKTYYIIFALTQQTGKRGGGYRYEKEIGDSFYASGVPVKMPGNVKLTDVFICKKKYGIEIKAASGRFGEPTLMYDYIADKFNASENTKQAGEGEMRSADIVTIALNGESDDAKSARQWMRSIRDVWAASTGEELKKFTNNITAKQYDMYLKGKVAQSADPVKISIDDIIKYYIGKEAKYFQIQGKGLYAIDDVLDLNVPLFATAAADTQPSVKVQMALTKDKKVLRATISLDLSKLKNSVMNLDDPQDLATVASRCTLADTSEGVTVLKTLISEELTASDKREIERISRRQARIELERTVGSDFGKAMREEVTKILGSKATRDEIAEMIEAVLKRLHVEIGK